MIFGAMPNPGLCRMRHERRTAAKLCRAKGGELEQIQFLLGPESILMAEREGFYAALENKG
jgi:hypothetical protein